MSDKLYTKLMKCVLSILVTAALLPLSWLLIVHGSSAAFELAVFFVGLNVYVLLLIFKTKGQNENL